MAGLPVKIMRKRHSCIFIGITIVLIAAGVMLFWPTSPSPSGPLPNPNGYDELSRAGEMIDHLVGIACEAMGSSKLAKLVPGLGLAHCKALIAELESIEAKREPLAEALRIEQAWSRNAGGPWDGVAWKLRSRSLNPTKKLFDTDYVPKLQAETARQSQILIDLAKRAFELEKGHPPPTLDELVPAYLKSLPRRAAGSTNSENPRWP